MDKLRPRGLVNSGNMCFANSVLQVLVYCPPFHAFFAELGKVMNVKSKSTSGDTTPSSSNIDWKTPLVQATAEFLTEFTEGKDRQGGEKGGAWEERIARSSHGGGSKGKGKGKEIEKDAEWDEEWESSFLPTNIYDAMKEKKRFDSMRVCLYFVFLLSAMLIIYRVERKKMRRNSLGSTSTLWKKSCYLCPT
jgi:ubiquitin carboxyl-terminal hydrolase 10